MEEYKYFVSYMYASIVDGITQDHGFGRLMLTSSIKVRSIAQIKEFENEIINILRDESHIHPAVVAVLNFVEF